MSTHPRIARKGWKPDLPDHRDFLRDSASLPAFLSLPDKADLRPDMPPVYNQGQLGSCTANAIAAAIQHAEAKAGIAYGTPARLFIYYNERVLEGDPETDGGAQIRDGIKSVASLGACNEDAWPYDESKVLDMPGPGAFALAEQHVITKYERCNQDKHDLMAAVAGGQPVIFGFTVYAAFEGPDVARTGVLGMPAAGEAMVGGHAVCIVGYDESRSAFLCRNSWSSTWGIAGYFWMPMDYVTNPGLADDFWVIEVAS